MAIKKFNHKSLRPDENVTSEGKNAIIETKEIEHCYPQHGITIKATSKQEADKKLKELLN